jgi:hypothetical protein
MLRKENNKQMIFSFFKAISRERKDKPKTNTNPKPLLEIRDSLESAGGSSAHKFTINLDNKQNK